MRSTGVGGMIFVHAGLCIFLAGGLACVFAPKRVRTYALRSNRHLAFGVSNPLIEWMKTDGYLTFLRMMGVVFVIFVSVVEVLFVRSLSAQ